ncbi:unnamed protein product [Adineta steineri]|uniref:Ion transport domain-containing protein n=1 Tax=Adineta steineri TaxID=433720 RepID=A0A814FH73_9BILA|nr:unnamed protein product [Adineta steineri]CAF1497863.1 unnamed protein product [Adineta steineri]
MKDLSFFVCFISIFLIGYSVTSYSLITTEQQVNWYQTSGNSPSTTYTLANDGSGLWNFTIIRNVIDWGMWKVYGQVELLDHQQVDDNTISADNDAYGNTVFVFTIIFVCIANVLLLNVLVALFNVTLEKTKEHAHISWAYQRNAIGLDYFRITKEYPLGEQIGTENGDSSIKKFSAPKIKIEKDQYLGIRFSSEAGSPFSTERNQYYCYFDGETDPETPLQFTRCWTKGIAMSFHVQPTQAERYTYRIYDNILRERSIAQDYWENVIECLKKEERHTIQQYSAEEANWKKVVKLVHESNKNHNQPRLSNE